MMIVADVIFLRIGGSEMELQRVNASVCGRLQQGMVMMIAIALSGCGGSGFYGPNTSAATSTSSTTSSSSSSSSSSSTTSATSPLSMTASKPSMLVSGDTDVITVTLVDGNNQPLSGQTISLAIADTQDNQVTITSSSPTTNSQGQATFTISMPAETGTVAQNLKNSGLLLMASYLSPSTHLTVTQSLTVNVVTSVAVIAIASHLTMSIDSTPATSSGGLSMVSVQALGPDNSPIPDQNVSLSIPNAQAMGVFIDGATQSTTNATGTATFAVVQSGNPVSDPALLAQGVSLLATSTDSSQQTVHQSTIVPTAQP